MTARLLKHTGLALGLALTPVTPIWADDEMPAAEQSMMDPESFISVMITDLRAIDSDVTGDEAVRNQALRTYLTSILSLSRMNRFVLSRDSRKAADPADLEAYDSLFEDYISAVFSDQIDDLVRRDIRIDEVITRRPGDFIVRSTLFDKSGDERARIDWRAIEDDDKLRLVDVMVEGLSVNVERRAQFSAIVKNDGFPALLDHMREVAAGEG
ncbi:MAG: ABC transporter substrate-binding protein [Pseudomonadota bacterium]